MPLELHQATTSDIDRLIDLQYNADPSDPRLVAFYSGVAGHQRARAHLASTLQMVSGYGVTFVVDTDAAGSDGRSKAVNFSMWKVHLAKEEGRYSRALDLTWIKNQAIRTFATTVWMTMQDQRKSLIGDEPHILLNFVAAEQTDKYKGAASLIMEECCLRADTLGLPVFLEAKDDLVEECQHFGFDVVHGFTVDYDRWNGVGVGLTGKRGYLLMRKAPSKI